MNQIDQFRTQEMVIPDMDAKLRRILEKVEPHHAFSRAMTSRLKEHGVQLFGENAEVAHALWSSALFLRTSELPKNVTNKSVREPLIKMLVDQQYDDARGYIEELMAQYPKVLPPFVEEQLQIEPRELLKLYAQENDETSSTRLKHSESEQEQVREQAQILSDVAGKVLVSPDGKFSIKVDNGGQAIRSEGAVGSGAERFLVERISDQDGLLAHRRYNRSFFSSRGYCRVNQTTRFKTSARTINLSSVTFLGNVGT